MKERSFIHEGELLRAANAVSQLKAAAEKEGVDIAWTARFKLHEATEPMVLERVEGYLQSGRRVASLAVRANNEGLDIWRCCDAPTEFRSACGPVSCFEHELRHAREVAAEDSKSLGNSKRR